MEKPENNKKAQEQKTAAYYLLLELALEFALMLALPLIGGVYLGKWLDLRYHTKFWVIVCLLGALAFSALMIGKKINQVRKSLK